MYIQLIYFIFITFRLLLLFDNCSEICENNSPTSYNIYAVISLVIFSHLKKSYTFLPILIEAPTLLYIIIIGVAYSEFQKICILIFLQTQITILRETLSSTKKIGFLRKFTTRSPVPRQTPGEKILAERRRDKQSI